MNIQKNLGKIIALALVLGFFVFYFYALNFRSEPTSRVDLPAVNFKTEDINGNQVRLSDFTGQVVVINFFATWCPPCIEEAPELEKFEANYSQKAKLVFIDRGEPKERVVKYAKEHKNSTYLLDLKNEIATNYGVVGQPETFVIDKNGIIKEYIQGPIKYEELTQLVDKYQ